MGTDQDQEAPQLLAELMGAVAHPGLTLKGGRYEIERLLRSAPGKGVYLARDHLLDCAVVVDVIPTKVMVAGASGSWEARVLGRLGDHPNIATVIDHWQESGTSFMVSRYLTGGSLQDLIDAAKANDELLPVDRIIVYALQLARALEHIHGRRIVYRDLQPRNVLLDNWGTLRLVDFDTAISLDDPEVPPISDGRSVEHMAPEVAASEAADERADLYSLGTTIYAMCTGNAPDTGARDQITRGGLLGSRVLERADLPEGLKSLVSGLMAPRPQDRPASAAEVARCLAEVVTSQRELESLLASDETATLEFKSSLRTPLGPTAPSDVRSPKELERALELQVIKTAAAFLNTGGGTIVIGVDDRKAIVGIEADFPRTKGSRDGWRRTFDDLVSESLGPDALPFIDLQLAPYRDKIVAIIKCQQRDQPTWLYEELFVRRTATTERLSTRQAWSWCREHWRS